MHYIAHALFFLLVYHAPALSQQVDWTEVEGIGFSRYQYPFVETTENGKKYLYHLESGLKADDTEDHAADLMVVIKDGLYGVFKKDGRLILPYEYDEIDLQYHYDGQWYEGIPYHYKYIIFKKDGKYGYANEEGHILSQPQYQNILIISRTIVAMQQDHQWGWMEGATGEVRQPCTYDDVGRMYFSDNYVEIEKNKQVGLARVDGSIIIPIKYQRLYTSQTAENTYIQAIKDTFITLYDSTGTEKISGHFDDLSPMRYTASFRYKKGNQYGLLNPLSGKMITEAKYSSIGNGLWGRHIVKQGQHYGVIDDTGKTIIPIRYEKIEFINANGDIKYDNIIKGPSSFEKSGNLMTEEHLARIIRDSIINELPHYIRVQQDNTHGIFNWAGKSLVMTEKYSHVIPHYHDKVYFKVYKEELFGILNDTDQEILPIRYTEDRSYQYSKSAIETKHELLHRYISFSETQTEDSYTNVLGLFDLETATVVVPPAPQRIDWLNENYFKVTQKTADYTNLVSLYNQEAKLVYDFGQEVDNIFSLGDEDLFLIEKQSYYHLSDLKGHILYSNPTWQTRGHYMPVRFPEFEHKASGDFHAGLKKIYAEEGNLFVDIHGQEKRFSDYQYVDDFYTGTALMAKKTPDDQSYAGFRYRYGLIDQEGNVLQPAVWDHVSVFPHNPNLLLVVSDEKWGMVNRDGSYLLPLLYDYIESSSSYPTLQIMSEGKYGLTTLDGTIVIDPHYDQLYRDTNGDEKTWPLLVQDGEWYYFLKKDGTPYPIRAKQRTY